MKSLLLGFVECISSTFEIEWSIQIELLLHRSLHSNLSNKDSNHILQFASIVLDPALFAEKMS